MEYGGKVACFAIVLLASRSCLCYSVASVCRLYGMYCG